MELVATAQNYLNNWYFYLFPEQSEVKEDIDTWEDLPVVMEFYRIKDFEHLTQPERECIATAYSINDRYFDVYHYMCVGPGHHMDEVLGQGW
jgi:hypothetical protein